MNCIFEIKSYIVKKTRDEMVMRAYGKIRKVGHQRYVLHSRDNRNKIGKAKS